MSALPTNPFRKPIDELTDIIHSIGRGPHIRPLEPITNAADIESAERTQAIALNRATPAQLAAHESLTAPTEALIETMYKYVVKRINSDLDCTSIDAIEVELVGSLYRAWIADDRQRVFSGVKFNGNRWMAMGTVVVESGEWVRMSFRVENE